MNKNLLKISWITLAAIVIVFAGPNEVRASDSIDFPEDELALESVLPKFDRPEAVKKRNVSTENKFELGGYYGWNILEPIQNQSKLGFNLGYHWNEDSALVLNYAIWNPGLNTEYTDGLAATPNNLDFDRAPALKNSIFAHYEWKVFYGKISFTKEGVVNVSTYPIFGAGLTAYEHKSYPGIDVGIGQKFYFGKSMALRADFKMQYGTQPSPFLRGKMKDSQAPPADLGEFNDKAALGTVLDIGISFLL